ncbi:MAG TPA: hypothetical protein VGX23_21565 [Actinocrinis sp.]|nr:hypothetical protein [Actinocrinis sp.]
MDVKITTVAQRPELAQGLLFADTWPVFCTRGLVGGSHFGRIAEVFPDYVLAATDGTGQVVARGCSVPFAGRAAGRDPRPARGYEQVLVWAFQDRRDGLAPDVVSAADITVRADRLGRGLSRIMLEAMRHNTREQGINTLIAPVRPSAKHAEPGTPMSQYMHRTRPDGLPADPWLRTHVRAGGVIEKPAPASMTVSGSLAQWREWTGLPFDADGPVLVPGALVPVQCSVDNDVAVYVEPNVWVRHDC